MLLATRYLHLESSLIDFLRESLAEHFDPVAEVVKDFPREFHITLALGIFIAVDIDTECKDEERRALHRFIDALKALKGLLAHKCDGKTDFAECKDLIEERLREINMEQFYIRRQLPFSSQNARNDNPST